MNQLKRIHATAASGKSRLMQRASLVTLSGVSFLIILKLIAWIETDSVSLLSSLVDSVMDILASLINFGAIYYSLQPPDKEHRFGHGKVEYIAGLGQVIFIFATASVVMIEAIRRFFHPVPLTHEWMGMGVMGISLVVTLGMVWFQRYVIRRTGSTTVKADAFHYLTDILANAAVLVSFVLAMGLGWLWADPVIAIGVSLYIFHGAWKLGRQSFDNLMDREFSDEERQRIKDVVTGQAGVKGMHEMKTRHSGILAFIQFHIDVDGKLPLSEAHEITEAVEKSVQELFPHAEVLIHTDPV